ACAARQQKQKHYDRQRVHGMTQEQDEALDESDLHQNVSQPDGDEVEQSQRTRLLASSPPSQGKNQKQQHSQERDGQDHAKHGHAQVHFPVDPLHQRLRMQDLSKLQSEEEERSVVGHRRHVVRV